jgi:hypothetical protein
MQHKSVPLSWSGSRGEEKKISTLTSGQQFSSHSFHNPVAKLCCYSGFLCIYNVRQNSTSHTVHWGTAYCTSHSIWLIFSHVCILARSAYYLCTVCPYIHPSIHLSTCISLFPTKSISAKCHTGDFYETLLRKTKFG